MASVEDKVEIYQNTYKIKDLVNLDGQGYYFNDYLPAELNELKRCERDIFRKNNNLSNDKQLNMEWKNGRLHAEGNPYRKPLREPRNEDLLQLPVEQLDSILDVQLTQSKPITMMKSTFIGYTCQAKSLNDVEMAYQKLRLLHGSARHIICSYKIASNDLQVAESHCDDGEFGAGRVMLKYLNDNGYDAIAVFVVRYFGGVKMGPD